MKQVQVHSFSHRQTLPQPGAVERPSRPGVRPTRAPAWVGLLLFVTQLLACSTNRCQSLCDAYYQMANRCDLFGVRSGQQPETCLRDDSDPQVLQQRNDYATRQCRQDFREVSCSELKPCCQSECFNALVSEYDAISGTQEQNYEQQREVCHKFQQLAETGEASWCSALQKGCVQSWCETAKSDCPDAAASEPLCTP